jgi:hypothetical protein
MAPISVLQYKTRDVLALVTSLLLNFFEGATCIVLVS